MFWLVDGSHSHEPRSSFATDCFKPNHCNMTFLKPDHFDLLDLHFGLYHIFSQTLKLQTDSPDFSECFSHFLFLLVSTAAQPNYRNRRKGGRVWVGLSLGRRDEQQRAQHAGSDPSGCSGHPNPPLTWKPSSPWSYKGWCQFYKNTSYSADNQI